MSELLQRGDWVEVLSAAEILATLDHQGQLDGLPFMPEMAALCGRRFQVRRRADKTCVEGFGLRRFEGVVLLDEVRCDGAAHDGCQRNCLVFWKDAWLKAVAGPHAAAPDEPADAQALVSALPIRRGEHYVCQSTELGGSTAPLSKWDLSHLVRDVLRGDLALGGFLVMAARTAANVARRRFGLPEIGALVGEAGAAPLGGLGLKPGERVRIRSLDAIQATLGRNSKAGGLSFEVEMARYAGHSFEVDFPVRRIIHEETGRMVQLKDTVALKGLTCMGSCVRNCPRANTLYWREAWLERFEPAPTGRPRRPVKAAAGPRNPAARRLETPPAKASRG